MAKHVLGITKTPANFPLCLALAEKWAPVFKIPVDVVLTICKIESAFRPGAINMTAVAQGGAWGAMQQTLATAKGHVTKLRTHPNASVRVTVGKFDGSGTSLLEPDLNILLGSYHLGKLWAEFRDFNAMVFAYHAGAVPVRKMLAEGKRVTPETIVATRPKSRAYLTKALAVRESVQEMIA